MPLPIDCMPFSSNKPVTPLFPIGTSVAKCKVIACEWRPAINAVFDSSTGFARDLPTPHDVRMARLALGNTHPTRTVVCRPGQWMYQLEGVEDLTPENLLK